MLRSGFVESVHRGSVVVLAPDGTVRLALGEVNEPVFTRSCNKPLQALGLLRTGLDLPDDADLAVGCGSHSGEPEHVRQVLGILAKAGLTEADLGCPPDWPMDEAARNRVIAAGGGKRRAAMNCSGKHAMMLATSVQQAWDIIGYLDPEHPAQLAIAATVTEMTGEDIATIGVDGCGAPLFALTLTGLATGYSALIKAADGTLESRVADAMRTHAHLVGGTHRDDTELMQAIPGLLVKGGAEGVHAMVLPDGTAMAMKIDDGAPRPRTPILVGVLRALGYDAPELDDKAERDILGGGVPVGAARLREGLLDGLA
ncbi:MULTISPECIES: asparaginase [Actinokineospora]|uniref:Asparaginase n=1 Tax=Actinokineospora fastidiosa TaxID=1816 RepID=A0A918G749_9PSEU|nr:MULTISPECIES: asparaginase [Actinokineospora]UVS82477.1 L-asparaginase II [Actinokineospora sp. UTMC 2448]GGS20851.1 asparaginase [Actinokineospora fastidiosa]